MKLDRLEVYLLAADNPVGKRQLRPIFRRKRSGEVLTREQVDAIKKGRQVLRKEMKEQGLKRRIDFEVTATNLGLYFDRNRLLWPFFLWLIRDNTVAKVLATTVMLSTAMVISEPLIDDIRERTIVYLTEYITERYPEYIIKTEKEIVTEYITVTETVPKYITEEVNRFTIDLDDDMVSTGFEMSETQDFAKPTSRLVCSPAVGIPCISIQDIPAYVDTVKDGEHHDVYFAYTFYCKYEAQGDNQVAADYNWYLKLAEETKDLSEATWVMVFEDGLMNFYAEVNENGLTEVLPVREETEWAYAGAPLRDLCKTPETQYEVIQEGAYFDYCRVIPIDFVSDTIAAQGRQVGVRPGDVHKYTVVLWLEGDDPECTDAMIGGQIGMTFQFELENEYAAPPQAS